MKQVPPYLRETKLHINTCIKYVELKYPNLDEDLKKILVNVYRKESNELLNFTNQKFLNNKVELNDIEVSLNCKKLKLKTFLKVLINNIFLLVSKKKKFKNNILVRSWVEDCLNLFKKDVNNDCIFLVYPFAIKLKRQLDFLKDLKSQNLTYTFMGVNYSYKDLFKWIFSSDDIDFIKMEYNAYKKHAQFISSKFNIKKILTTDEFEVSSFVLYNNISSDVDIINSAHGIGKYSPFVKYTEFYVFNNAQEDYYKSFSNDIIYKLIEKTKYNNFNFNRKVILISQAFDYNDNSFISNEELKIIKYFDNLDINVDFFIKTHPNSKIQEFKSTKNNMDLIYRGNSLENSLFLTLFSTAYYDFEKFGITYLVETESNKPKLIFGEKERVIKLNDIETLLSRFN